MKRAIAAVILVATLAVAGCATADSYPTATAATLQSRVLSVTESVASSDFASALDRLGELEVDVQDALARGNLTPERRDSILAAITMVRDDLESAIQAEEEAQREREAEEQDRKKDKDNGNGNGRGNGGGDDDEDDD